VLRTLKSNLTEIGKNGPLLQRAKQHQILHHYIFCQVLGCSQHKIRFKMGLWLSVAMLALWPEMKYSSSTHWPHPNIWEGGWAILFRTPTLSGSKLRSPVMTACAEKSTCLPIRLSCKCSYIYISDILLGSGGWVDMGGMRKAVTLLSGTIHVYKLTVCQIWQHWNAIFSVR